MEYRIGIQCDRSSEDGSDIEESHEGTIEKARK